jgi:hypothetical protein
MSESKLKLAQDSIRNAVWEYTHTIDDVLLLCRSFHAWAGYISEEVSLIKHLTSLDHTMILVRAFILWQRTLEMAGRSRWIMGTVLTKLGFRNEQKAFRAWAYRMLRCRRLRATYIKLAWRWDGACLKESLSRWHLYIHSRASVEKKLRVAHDLIAAAMSSGPYRDSVGKDGNESAGRTRHASEALAIGQARSPHARTAIVL